jgi:predicted DNA-binding transcriptional regulator YafY
VVLRIRPESAEGALRWRFHSDQQLATQPDGSVVVRFRASGMRELAWHLFTWGDQVEIQAPPRLKDLLVEQIETARRAHVRN